MSTLRNSRSLSLTALAFSLPMRISTFWPADLRLELRIRKFILHAGLRERDRTLKLGRGEQVVDHFDQAIIEVLRRMPEAFVRLLKQRVVANIGRDQCLGVAGTDQLHQRFVALVVGRIQHGRLL